MRILKKSVQLRVALLMALALLFAQLGAQLHAYSHLHAGSHVTDQLYDRGGPCSDCLSFAPLLASAGGPSQLLRATPVGMDVAPATAVRTLISLPAAAAFRSRAPPSIQ